MTETIRYSQIAKEDIKLEPRNGQFEVTMPDGSIATLSALDVAYLLADAYTEASPPSSPAVGQVWRQTDGVLGLWSQGQRGGSFGLNGEVANIKEFGGIGDGVADNTAALNAAISAMANKGGVVFFPPGTYRFLSRPNAIGTGTLIQGSGGIGLTSGYGTWLIADYTESSPANGFLTWDGSAASGAGLGGGIRDCVVYRASGKTSGTALKFTGTTDALRAGLNVVSRVTVSGAGSWSHGLLVDGTGLNTTGNQGIRTTHVAHLRVDNCSVASQSIWLRNATEFVGTGVVVTAGSSTATSGITVGGAVTVNGDSSDVSFIGLFCDGDFNVDYGTDITVQGTVLGVLTIDSTAVNFHFAGVITALSSIANSSTTATFSTQLGQPAGGPYMRWLTNRTGGSLAQGDVVALDSANDSSVVLQDSSGALFSYVVAAKAIASNAVGPFVMAGIAVVNVDGTVTRGHYIKKSSTTKLAVDTGTAQGAATNPAVGSIGLALTGDSGGQITALLFGAQAVTAASAAAVFSITSGRATVSTQETTTSVAYTDLATVGPAITLSPGGPTDQVIHHITALVNSAASSSFASVAYAGAAASDSRAILNIGTNAIRAASFHRPAAVVNGSTHTMKYRVSAGTGTFDNRDILGFTIS